MRVKTSSFIASKISDEKMDLECPFTGDNINIHMRDIDKLIRTARRFRAGISLLPPFEVREIEVPYIGTRFIVLDTKTETACYGKLYDNRFMAEQDVKYFNKGRKRVHR